MIWMQNPVYSPNIADSHLDQSLSSFVFSETTVWPQYWPAVWCRSGLWIAFMGNVDSLPKISQKLLFSDMPFSPHFSLLWKSPLNYLPMVSSCLVAALPALPTVACTSITPNLWIARPSAVPLAQNLSLLRVLFSLKQLSWELRCIKTQILHLVTLAVYEVYKFT